MQQREFVELHGSDLWKQEVEPRQREGNPDHIRANANILVHNDMVLPWIQRMCGEGFIDADSAGVSLLWARTRFLVLHSGDGNEQLWDAVLAYCRKAAPMLQSERVAAVEGGGSHINIA
jgi:hypothetical protein